MLETDSANHSGRLLRPVYGHLSPQLKALADAGGEP